MKSSLVTSKQTVDVIDHAKTGAKMRAARKATGISLRELASQMGFTPPYVSDLELGKRNWSDLLVNKYHEALTAFKISLINDAQKRAHKSNFHIGAKK